MTTTKTADVEGTLASRSTRWPAPGPTSCAAPATSVEAAEGLAQIVPRSPVPIIADIHNQYRRALEALDAGVACLRLNPGNIRKPEHIKTVARECKDRGVPIRIGVNGGSLDKELYEKYGDAITPEAMVESAQRELDYFREVDFDDVKISVKASNVPIMIEAYRQLADAVDYPLHLGVTEAGPPPAGLVKATAGMATLLSEGIGDTIRYSLTADPVEEARAGRQLLEALGLRERKGLDLIACPSCGRAEVDVIEVANEAQAALERPAASRSRWRSWAAWSTARARPARPTWASPPAATGATCSSRARSSRSCPRTTWSRRWSSGPSIIDERGHRGRAGPRRSPAPRPRPRPTGPRCSTRRATTPTRSAVRIERIRKH